MASEDMIGNSSPLIMSINIIMSRNVEASNSPCVRRQTVERILHTKSEMLQASTINDIEHT